MIADWIFGHNRREQKEHAKKVAKRATIEIVANKQAQQEVVQKAHRVNRELKELIEENGFHVAIYLASGGKIRGRETHKAKGRK